MATTGPSQTEPAKGAKTKTSIVPDNAHYELNDRQNGWQANARVDNRNDEPHPVDEQSFNNNWRDRQWRETAYGQQSHPWRETDDERNEQRNGSEYTRDRSAEGNSRFHDDDYGYRTSGHEDLDYGQSDGNNDRGESGR